MAMTNEYEAGYRLEVRGETADFDFLYPRSNPVKSLTVGLEDVRAANNITITYDFERDGWVITSPTRFMWDAGDDLNDDRPEEVAFIPAYSAAGEAELDRMNAFPTHTLLADMGVDLFTIQRIAGHADLATTRRYVGKTPAAMASAADKLGEAIG